MKEVTLVGTVHPIPFGVGSKSERLALELRTPSGNYEFRISGENPYELARNHRELYGRTIRATGYLDGRGLVVHSYRIE